METPSLTVVTWGAGLGRATGFYAGVRGTPPDTDYDGVTFFELPCTWIPLYPIDDPARDISPQLSTTRAGLDGYRGMIAWGPMFGPGDDGPLRIKPEA